MTIVILRGVEKFIYYAITTMWKIKFDSVDEIYRVLFTVTTVD